MAKSSSKPQLKAVPVAGDGPPQRVPFVTDAEREGLAIVNTRDKGAPVLDVDAVLRRTLPNHVKDSHQ